MRTRLRFTARHLAAQWLTGCLCLAATVGVLLLPGCGARPDSSEAQRWEAKFAALETDVVKLKQNPHRPRLGDIMEMTQIRHAKLWFAGENQNWELAAYELHEMKEGFEDLEKHHPTHGKPPIPLAQTLQQIMDPQLAQLSKAIQAGDKQQFVQAFDVVTVSCNVCHQTAKVSFNLIKRPTLAPFSNQEFAPQK